ncbi:MAG: hypothetical protein OXU61_09160 [Gammaproteobacteria bacterium]|nr:hypothetical protein [Gammaproteobacteria bacterium]
MGHRRCPGRRQRRGRGLGAGKRGAPGRKPLRKRREAKRLSLYLPCIPCFEHVQKPCGHPANKAHPAIPMPPLAIPMPPPRHSCAPLAIPAPPSPFLRKQESSV